MLKKITAQWDAFKQDENGASAIEYAVMAAILVGVIVVALAFLDFGSAFTGINAELNPV
jgi:pilus assembly protein Flp/PilA